MNLGPTQVSTSYTYVLNQNGATAITLGNGNSVDWDAGGVVAKAGNQTVAGIKTFSSTIVGTIDNATTSANCSRSVIAGNGMTGGGALTSNSTLTLGTPSDLSSTSTNSSSGTTHTHVINATIARSAITITAGAGMTGGGDLTTNRTLDIVAAGGGGITVNADNITVDSTVVRTTGDQTLAGNKTFTNDVVVNGNTTIGSDNADTLIINAGPITFPNAVSAAESLIFGGDANLYRSAADTLKTDDSLVVGGAFSVGTSATIGTTLNVVGHFSAATKSFLIDHPTKPEKKLQYACLEGPENGVYVRGRNNQETIYLPDYWVDLVHEDSITVSLTPINVPHQNLFIKKISNDKIIVGGSEFKDYFYTVYGERKDVEKLQVEI